jgi:hypothetical protein
VNTPNSGAYSTECDAAPDAEAIDGYVGAAYAKLMAKQTDPQTSKVCFQVDGSGVNKGGNVTISSGGVSPSLPDVDEQGGACSTASGNEVPGSHPLPIFPIEGGGNPGDPTYFGTTIDTYSTDGEAWVCLQAVTPAGTFGKRVKVTVPGTEAPDVDVNLDDPPVTAPAPDQGTVGYASSTCQSLGGEGGRIVNADVSDGHLSAYSRQPSASKAQLCVRLDGATGVGGMLEVDTTGMGVSGVTPIVQDGNDMTPCGTLVFGSGSVFRLERSSSTNPASICVNVNGTMKSFTVGVSGSPVVTPPTIHWTPDPGTPVPEQHLP